MSPDLWLPLATTLLFFAAGVILTILPVFPGPVLVFAGVAIFHFWLPEDSPGTTFLLISLGLTLLTLILDFILSIVGARRYGATWKGSIGALIGGIVGIFLPPPLFWIFFGPVVGAIIGEILGGRGFKDAGRAGWGTFLGAMVALATKLAVCFFIIVGFAFLLIRHLSHA
ncbi:DUF456 domain-containing protein [Puniceicoccus vermicola]|uniref:DUF456 domain-containing protein n=1 Tax=Puniceicoccus vermicola TaxID=388746 RepID=A0A7X1AXB7_9BACT|nr:DUF456 domain-containing protein [Puniceicoccus vermicola]MBC2601750.1 DUF456 domain-containing protein [Puniceicoccus vermicola]